jgi:hypothetical protein
MPPSYIPTMSIPYPTIYVIEKVGTEGRQTEIIHLKYRTNGAIPVERSTLKIKSKSGIVTTFTVQLREFIIDMNLHRGEIMLYVK